MSGFFHLPLDLPFATRAPARLLGWIAAALVFLAVGAFGLAVAGSAEARRQVLEPQLLTVLLPVTEGRGPTEADVARVTAALGALDGVAFARPVSVRELGFPVEGMEASQGAAPPMPRFIDLALNPGRRLTPETLAARLAELEPSARMVPDQAWPAQAAFPVTSLRQLGLAVGVTALAALAATVAAVTRLSLALHRETIDLLRQLGAPDAYIARQLEQHALGQVLRGGLVGFLLALLALAVGMARTGQPRLALPTLDWLLLGSVPMGAGLLALAAAGLAARWRTP